MRQRQGEDHVCLLQNLIGSNCSFAFYSVGRQIILYVTTAVGVFVLIIHSNNFDLQYM